MRTRVFDILDLFVAVLGPQDILAKLPDLEPEELEAVLLYAARRFDHPVLTA